ncbi:MAG: DUF308 domain-containing protein [Clostridia bacterium]|nr:DUF308 domain-containing protein [Clostridia bacterium]
MKPRSVAPMRIAKIGYIIVSALIVAIGVVFILRPFESLEVLGIVCGGVMLAFGAIKIVGYFSKDLYRLAFQFDLEFGTIMLIIGFCIAAQPERLISFFSVVMGLAALTDGLLKIRIAVQSKNFGLETWPVMTVFACLSCVAGIVLMFWPQESAKIICLLLGICLVADGILNILVVLFTVKIVKNQQPDKRDFPYRDATYTDIIESKTEEKEDSAEDGEAQTEE